MRLRVFEKMPTHLAWILEEDRRVTYAVPDRRERNFNLVRPVFAEQEGTNVEIATNLLHAPLLYERCRIHPRKRVRPSPRPLGHDRVYSSAAACASALISHTSVVASGLAVGGDVEKALESVGVPSYVLDEMGIVRWINPAAERLLGDIRGRHFTSVVAPEDSPTGPRAGLPEAARHLPGNRGDGLPAFDHRNAGGRGAQRGAAHER